MKKIIIYCLLLLALPTSLLAQTYTVGTTGADFPTLFDAFDFINNANTNGDLIIQIIDNTTETVPAVLNSSGVSHANYTSILIYPTVPGLSISGNVAGPLIDLNGADNVTFDGRVNDGINPVVNTKDLVITNTNTGGSASTIRFIESANTNKIQYCFIKGSETSTSSGIISFSTATAGTGNNNNLIDNNDITSDLAGRPVNAIYSSGTSGQENSGNTISNNNIYDILNNGLASNGIFLDVFNTSWTISGNSFYETASFVPTASVAYNLLQIINTGTNYTITGNYFGGQAVSCGGAAWNKTNAFDNAFNAISLNVGTGTASNVKNNIIQNFAWSNSGPATWTGINLAGGDVNVGIASPNTIGAISGAGSITITGGSTGTNVYGINISGAGTVDCQDNEIGSINAANGAANASNFFGINKTATAGTTTIIDNTINGITASSASTGNTQIIYGISNSGTGNVEIRDNIVANLTNNTTNVAGSIAGLYFNGSTGTNAVRENFIYGLTTAGGSTSSTVYGIRINSGATSYYNNIISLGGNTQTTIYGIYETGTAGNNNNLYFNSVYIGGIPTAGTNNSYALYSAVTTNIRNFRNNIFYNARSNSGASGTHYAIYIATAGGTITTDYNDYFTSGTGGMLGYLGSNKPTLLDWQTATGQDSHSFAINPLFFNPGGSSASDYLGSETSLVAITDTGITTDFNGATRSLPAMGALVFGLCTNPTSGGTIEGAQSSCSSFDPVAFTSTLPASGQSGSILEYKWQLSIAGSGSGFTDIPSSNSATYDPGLTTQTTWYKRLARVSCIGNWTSPAQSNVLVITINTAPVANAITGLTAICMGGSLTLTSNATGTLTLTYTWASSNTAVATISDAGVLTTISGGSTNITYTVTDGNSPTCQATSAIHIVNVNALPVANPITGGNAVCMGGSLSLTPNATGTGTLSYTWFSENVSIETVSNTGVVTPMSPGVTNIRYTVIDGSSTACQVISGAYAVTVNALPVAGAITGGNDMCVGGSLSLTSNATGTPTLAYLWTSSNTGIATVSSTGVVTPVSAGSTNITYTVTDGSTTSCQATSAINVVTVNALPIAGAITGGNAVLLGNTLSLSSQATGTGTLSYVWNSSNTGVATVSNTGVVTPVSIGSTNITYTVTDGSSTSCQATSAILTVSVSLVVAGDITGGNAVCMGSTLSLTSHATGTATLTYIWTSSNTGVATVSNTGLVTPVSAGSTNITYTVTDGSPSAFQATSAILVLTVTALPAIGLVAGGTGTICSGTGTNITVDLSQTGTNYQLRNVSGNINVGVPVAGTGGTISLPTGNLTSNTTFNILATNALTNCSAVLTETEIVSVDALPAGGTITGGSGPITYGSSTGTFTLSGQSGTIVNWQNMVGTGSWIDISNTTTNYSETPSSAGTWQYRAQVINGSCPAVFSVPVSISVLPKSLTITANNQTKPYGTSFTFLGTEYTVTGLSSSDAVPSVSLSSTGAAATANVPGSPYTIIPATAIGTGLGNYTITYTNGSLSVTKPTLTVTADAQSKQYGTVNPSLAFTYSGWQNSEDESVLTTKPVASTTVTLTTPAGVQTGAITVAGGVDENYNFSYSPGDFTITKANLAFTADNKSRAYLIQNPVLTYTVAGYVNSESVSVLDVLPSVQTTALQSSNAGSYPITITGGSDNNYTYLYVPGTLSISKIPQTITFTGFPDKLLAEDSYTLTATSTSGLTVLFESLNTELATISGNNLTGVAKGNVSIRAYNTGDQNYNAAEVLATVKIYSTHKEIMHLFTPNNDGINDQWELPDLPTWGKCDVRVFNRWGKLVFADANYNNLWDGTSNGSPLPEGPYYFIIKTENAGVVKGTVNIVR